MNHSDGTGQFGELAIEATGLGKTYDKEILAVNDLGLAIESGQIYALLGPNGAGKTTTISMLTTMIKPTEGTARVAGFDILREDDKVRASIGVTFQETVLDNDLTGRQALDFHGKLYGQSRSRRRERSEQLLGLVELGEAADRRISTYSGGMKRRLELARGLMTEPEILFLDEPTLGLDPQNRTSIWDYIRDLKQRTGLTLLLTTHYMDEAKKLADMVGIIDNGNIVAEGTPRQLIDQMGSDVISINGHGDRGQLLEKLQELPFVEAASSNNNIIQVGVDAGNRRLVDVISAAADIDFTIEDISVAKPSLNDVFLKHTGRQLRDM